MITLQKNNIFTKSILLLVLFVGMLSFAHAQEATVQQTSDIPDSLTQLAQELNCSTKIECAAAFDADFEKGLELIDKYDIYRNDEDKKALAQSYKDEVLSQLSNIAEENLDETIIEIAANILKSKPELAEKFNLNIEKVEAAGTVILQVKNAGVNISVCRNPAETLSRDQLVRCLNASKNLVQYADVIEDYIPVERIERIERGDFDKFLEFEHALAQGRYPELGTTPDEAGFACLRPGSESFVSCDEIARIYFGDEGVRELGRARERIQDVEDYYVHGFENLELITPDGSTIVGERSIRETCDRAFDTRDIELARSCGEFAVRNGFATEEDMQDAINLFASVVAAPLDFDECRVDPRACEEFIPDEFRAEIDIYEIMREEMGFDPIQCERAFDPEIGMRCLEGAQRALPRIEALAIEFPAARHIVEEIKSHIAEGERMSELHEDFEDVFRGEGGPGGCLSEQECFTYCSNPVNGPECLTFGAKHEIFEPADVIERFSEYTEHLSGPSPIFIEQFPEHFNDQDYFPPYQPAFDDRFESEPDYSSTHLDQNFYPEPYYPEYGHQGPSPECFDAIVSGDFIRAKELCDVPEFADSESIPYSYPDPYIEQYPEQYQEQYPDQTQEPYREPYREPYLIPQFKPIHNPEQFPEQYPICPDIIPDSCPAEHFRQDSRDANGCYVPGECIPYPEHFPLEKPYQEPEIRSDCPIAFLECPAGEYLIENIVDGCPLPDRCEPIPEYTFPEPYPVPEPILNICPAMPTVDSCPDGQNRTLIFGSEQCGDYYGCEPSDKTGPHIEPLPEPIDSPTFCPSPSFWDPQLNACNTGAIDPFYCGDGVCTSDENRDSCSIDCEYIAPINSTDPQYGCEKTGGTWDGFTCIMPTFDATFTEPTFQQDPSVMCAGAGGTWDGVTCIIPTFDSAPIDPVSQPDPSVMCADAGGVWDGSICDMSSLQTASVWNAVKALFSRLFSRN
ncbi:hypothetical protein COB64_02195 [Candidatus Wolfebacteria bacterium]|nr:MAG: hypothetical protein COB64_02195 [Candidatus Wolfebacteria bacterium]